MANGMRQILFVLVPAAAAILALSEPKNRLIYQRGAFDPAQTTLVATALFWFAFSLPTNGLYLLQTRTFFSLQRPWLATKLAVIDLVVSALAALALYSPFGVGGIVIGTGIGTTAAVVAQAYILRREFGGLELHRLWSTSVRITVAAAALAGVSWVVWDVLDHALGRGLLDQIVSLGAALGAGGLAYVAAARFLRIAELEQIMRLLGPLTRFLAPVIRLLRRG
jgi:putative peptidoglycan lipid II flippase